MSHWSDALPESACSRAVEWAKTQPDYETAWAECTRADWMLWLVGRLDDSAPMSEERRPIVRCVLEIIGTMRHLMPPAGVSCVELLARWCDGADVSREDIYAAATAAAYAADAAAYAAATAAAYAADAAADAADATATDAAAAAIVRRHYPTPPVLR